MAVRHGYGKIAGADALVFAYDTGDTRNSYRGKPTTNFFTNGHFAGGTGITQEAGSNPTNEVVYFPNNPGGSDYVLRQSTGSQAEYQINLTTQLAPSTTYVMSGWYGESPDYVGESRMFHARAFSSTGAHNATGNGIGTVLKTVEIGGITWKYCYQTITTPSNYINAFNWYMGYSSTTYTGVRYYTNIMMEQGTVPSQFVNGTRSSTQGLLDLTGNSTIDLSNVSFDSNAQMTFDGTNDQILIDSHASVIPYGASTNITVEALVRWNDLVPNGVIVSYGGNGTGAGFLFQVEYSQGLEFSLFDGAGNNGRASLLTAGSTQYEDEYIHMAGTYDGSTIRLYINGVQEALQSYTYGYPQQSYFRLGNEYNRSYYANIDLPVLKIYNRALTAAEVKNNYNNYKGRFNL